MAVVPIQQSLGQGDSEHNATRMARIKGTVMTTLLMGQKRGKYSTEHS